MYLALPWCPAIVVAAVAAVAAAAAAVAATAAPPKAHPAAYLAETPNQQNCLRPLC